MNYDTTPTIDTEPFTAMWKGWVAPAFFVTLVAALSPWVGRTWLAVIAFASAMVIYTMVRRNRMASLPKCYVVPFLNIYVLGWGATFIAVLNVWYSPSLFPAHRLPAMLVGPTVPWLGAMTLYPLALLFSLWGTLMRYRLPYCRDCHIRFGTPAERGFFGIMYSQEGLFQRRLMLAMSAVLSVVTGVYTFLFFDPDGTMRGDILFYSLMPAAAFLLAALYLAIRYSTMWFYYSRDVEGAVLRQGASTVVRYIVICGDEIFLRVPDENEDLMPTEKKTDTPARLTLGYRRNVNWSDAMEWFLNLGRFPNSRGIEIRRMYQSDSAARDNNTFHYLAFADSRDLVEKSALRGQWFTLYQISEMMRNRTCSPMLAAEIHRLYTIAMAWKTYSRDGHRLYKIKHYRPTFRVSDIRKWNVDFGDSHWLWIAENNEDSMFYNVRRLWRRYVSGIND
ncbi:MAG: hypothetical protein NC336_08310 [Clostridium sp.]|nr:hypothetical protein [Clostridium sp.]